MGGMVVLRALAQLDNDLRSIGVYRSHEADLLPALSQVLLVDAQGVYPNCTRHFEIPEALQSCIQIGGSLQVPERCIPLVLEVDLPRAVWVTPAVG